MTKRKAMTPARRDRIMAAYDNGCAVTGCKAPGPYEIDHAFALGLGGTDDDDNLRPLCEKHHKKKTGGTRATSYGSDKHAMAKIDRLTGKTKTGPKQQIQNRGFDQRLRKKMNGGMFRDET